MAEEQEAVKVNTLSVLGGASFVQELSENAVRRYSSLETITNALHAYRRYVALKNAEYKTALLTSTSEAASKKTSWYVYGSLDGDADLKTQEADANSELQAIEQKNAALLPVYSGQDVKDVVDRINTVKAALADENMSADPFSILGYLLDSSSRTGFAYSHIQVDIPVDVLTASSEASSSSSNDGETKSRRMAMEPRLSTMYFVPLKGTEQSDQFMFVGKHPTKSSLLVMMLDLSAVSAAAESSDDAALVKMLKSDANQYCSLFSASYKRAQSIHSSYSLLRLLAQLSHCVDVATVKRTVPEISSVHAKNWFLGYNCFGNHFDAWFSMTKYLPSASEGFSDYISVLVALRDRMEKAFDKETIRKADPDKSDRTPKAKNLIDNSHIMDALYTSKNRSSVDQKAEQLLDDMKAIYTAYKKHRLALAASRGKQVKEDGGDTSMKDGSSSKDEKKQQEQQQPKDGISSSEIDIAKLIAGIQKLDEDGKAVAEAIRVSKRALAEKIQQSAADVTKEDTIEYTLKMAGLAVEKTEDITEGHLTAKEIAEDEIALLAEHAGVEISRTKKLDKKKAVVSKLFIRPGTIDDIRIKYDESFEKELKEKEVRIAKSLSSAQDEGQDVEKKSKRKRKTKKASRKFVDDDADEDDEMDDEEDGEEGKRTREYKLYADFNRTDATDAPYKYDNQAEEDQGLISSKHLSDVASIRREIRSRKNKRTEDGKDGEENENAEEEEEEKDETKGEKITRSGRVYHSADSSVSDRIDALRSIEHNIELLLSFMDTVIAEELPNAIGALISEDGTTTAGTKARLVETIYIYMYDLLGGDGGDDDNKATWDLRVHLEKLYVVLSKQAGIYNRHILSDVMICVKERSHEVLSKVVGDINGSVVLSVQAAAGRLRELCKEIGRVADEVEAVNQVFREASSGRRALSVPLSKASFSENIAWLVHGKTNSVYPNRIAYPLCAAMSEVARTHASIVSTLPADMPNAPQCKPEYARLLWQRLLLLDALAANRPSTYSSEALMTATRDNARRELAHFLSVAGSSNLTEEAVKEATAMCVTSATVMGTCAITNSAKMVLRAMTSSKQDDVRRGVMDAFKYASDNILMPFKADDLVGIASVSSQYHSYVQSGLIVILVAYARLFSYLAGLAGKFPELRAAVNDCEAYGDKTLTIAELLATLRGMARDVDRQLDLQDYTNKSFDAREYEQSNWNTESITKYAASVLHEWCRHSAASSSTWGKDCKKLSKRLNKLKTASDIVYSSSTSAVELKVGSPGDQFQAEMEQFSASFKPDDAKKVEDVQKSASAMANSFAALERQLDASSKSAGEALAGWYALFFGSKKPIANALAALSEKEEEFVSGMRSKAGIIGAVSLADLHGSDAYMQILNKANAIKGEMTGLTSTVAAKDISSRTDAASRLANAYGILSDMCYSRIQADEGAVTALLKMIDARAQVITMDEAHATLIKSVLATIGVLLQDVNRDKTLRIALNMVDLIDMRLGWATDIDDEFLFNQPTESILERTKVVVHLTAYHSFLASADKTNLSQGSVAALSEHAGLVESTVKSLESNLLSGGVKELRETIQLATIKTRLLGSGPLVESLMKLDREASVTFSGLADSIRWFQQLNLLSMTPCIPQVYSIGVANPILRSHTGQSIDFVLPYTYYSSWNTAVVEHSMSLYLTAVRSKDSPINLFVPSVTDTSSLSASKGLVEFKQVARGTDSSVFNLSVGKSFVRTASLIRPVPPVGESFVTPHILRYLASAAQRSDVVPNGLPKLFAYKLDAESKSPNDSKTSLVQSVAIEYLENTLANLRIDSVHVYLDIVSQLAGALAFVRKCGVYFTQELTANDVGVSNVRTRPTICIWNLSNARLARNVYAQSTGKYVDELDVSFYKSFNSVLAGLRVENKTPALYNTLQSSIAAKNKGGIRPVEAVNEAVEELIQFQKNLPEDFSFSRRIAYKRLDTSTLNASYSRISESSGTASEFAQRSYIHIALSLYLMTERLENKAEKSGFTVQNAIRMLNAAVHCERELIEAGVNYHRLDVLNAAHSAMRIRNIKVPDVLPYINEDPLFGSAAMAQPSGLFAICNKSSRATQCHFVAKDAYDAFGKDIDSVVVASQSQTQSPQTLRVFLALVYLLFWSHRQDTVVKMPFTKNAIETFNVKRYSTSMTIPLLDYLYRNKVARGNLTAIMAEQKELTQQSVFIPDLGGKANMQAVLLWASVLSRPNLDRLTGNSKLSPEEKIAYSKYIFDACSILTEVTNRVMTRAEFQRAVEKLDAIQVALSREEQKREDPRLMYREIVQEAVSSAASWVILNEMDYKVLETVLDGSFLEKVKESDDDEY